MEEISKLRKIIRHNLKNQNVKTNSNTNGILLTIHIFINDFLIAKLSTYNFGTFQEKN